MICGSEGNTVNNGVEVVAATTSATPTTHNETQSNSSSNNNNQNNTTVISGNEVLSVSTADLAQMVSGAHGGNVQIRSAQPLTRATRRMLRGHTAHNASGERVLLINYISPNSTNNNTQVNTTNATIIQPSTSANSTTRRVIQTRGTLHHGSSNNNVNTSNNTATATATPVSLAGLGSEVTVTLKRSNKSAHNAGHIIRQQQHHQTTTPSNTIQATTTTSAPHMHSQSSPPPLVFTTHTAADIEHHELQEVEEIEDHTEQQRHHQHHHQQQPHQQQHHHHHQGQHQVIIHHHGNPDEHHSDIQYHHQTQHQQQHHQTTMPQLMSIQTQTQATSTNMDDDELLEYSTGNVDQVVEAAMAVDESEDVEEVVETHHIQQLHTVQLQAHQQAECLEDDEGEVEEVYLQ